VSIYSLGERKVEFRGEEWYVAHNATVIGSVVIGNQANIWFNVVIRGDSDLITVGERVNIQDASVLHTDETIRLTLGRNVCVGHKAMLHGCTVGDGSLVGINSVVMNGARIGKGSLIGANTLIPEGKEIPDGVLVLGSPGKIVRELKPEERANLLKIAAGYVERSKRYKTEFREQSLPLSAR